MLRSEGQKVTGQKVRDQTSFEVVSSSLPSSSSRSVSGTLLYRTCSFLGRRRERYGSRDHYASHDLISHVRSRPVALDERKEGQCGHTHNSYDDDHAHHHLTSRHVLLDGKGMREREMEDKIACYY